MTALRRSLVAAGAAVLLFGTPVWPAAGAEDEEPGTISGQVMTDELALPPADLCVEAHSFVRPPVAAMTDPLGRYTLDVAPGLYFVGFNTCEEHLDGLALEWWAESSGVLAATPVFVGPGEAVTGVDASLGPAGAVSGTVTDDGAGEPMSGACVVALDAGTAGIVRAVTGEDGTYSFGNLPGGSYQIAFGQCGDEPVYLPEVWDDHQILLTETAAEPEQVQIVPGDEVAGIDASLELGGLLGVEVTAAHTGRPAPLVCVTAHEGPMLEQAVAIAATGVEPFAISLSVPLSGDARLTVPAGSYGLEINSSVCGDDGYETTWYDGEVDPARAARVEVGAGDVVDGLTVVVRPRPSVSMLCGDDRFTPFDDVGTDHPHAVAVGCMARFEIVEGRSASRFAPGEPVRRDQMASLLARVLQLAGTTLPTDAPDAFDDDNGSAHERAINQLSAVGLLSGTGHRRFSPGAAVTRGQAATLLVAAYELATGLDILPGGDPFTDDEGDVHEPSTARAALAGLVAGTAPGHYAPSSSLQRDQAATVVARLLNRVFRDEIGGFGTATATATESGTARSSAWAAALDGPAIPLRTVLVGETTRQEPVVD